MAACLGRAASVSAVRWWSVDDVAEHLGVKRETVYRWIAGKRLPAHKQGKLWFFRADEVDAWMRDSGQAGQQMMEVASSTDVVGAKQQVVARESDGHHNVTKSVRLFRIDIERLLQSKALTAVPGGHIGRVACLFAPAGRAQAMTLDVIASKGSGDIQPLGATASALGVSLQAAAEYLSEHHEEIGVDAKWIQAVDFGVIADGAEPASDDGSAAAALVVGIASVLVGAAVRPGVAVVGKVESSGAVGQVEHVGARIAAARDAGYREILVPAANKHETGSAVAGMTVTPVSVCPQLVKHALSTARQRFTMAGKLGSQTQEQLDLGHVRHSEDNDAAH